MTTRNTPEYTVNISASPGEDSADFGYDAHFFNRAIISLSEFFLFNNARVLFGHDWREDGVMRAVADAAEKAASSRIFDDPDQAKARMVNIVPEKMDNISSLAKNAEKASGGILKVLSLQELIGIESDDIFGSPEYTPLKLLHLRKVLTEELNPGIRICLGGKTKKYTGFLPGIVEEALFALVLGKPLYILGGFGGAANKVANYLFPKNDSAALNAEILVDRKAITALPQKDFYSHICPEFFSQIENNGESSETPVNALDLLKEHQDKLTDTGLRKEENTQLVESTDLEEIKHLIHRGCNNVMPLK